MDFSYDEKDGKTRIIIYKEKDICAKCPEEIRHYCPLLMSIIDNLVYPSTQSMEIASCTFYDQIPKEFKEGVT